MIRMIKIIYKLSVCSLLICSIQSCDSAVDIEPNPFDEHIINQDTVNFVLEDIDPNSIAGLYQNIFKPTCSNIGCHDGTFEPDYRTIESSYYSMVYRNPIKNDGSLTYRVDPGNPDKSAIIKRLNGAIKPIMPIEIEPDGDWLENEDAYIQNVRNWIENGALDLAGNAPQLDFINPSLLGAFAMTEGTLLTRKDGYRAIQIPHEVNLITLYLGFDPINNPEAFTNNKLLFGYENEEGFQQDTSIVVEILNNPIEHFGLTGALINYTHRVELDLNALSLIDDQYFMRIRVQDGTHPITEIPSNNGLYYIKEYMSFHRTD